jgi:hypothetical protein
MRVVRSRFTTTASAGGVGDPSLNRNSLARSSVGPGTRLRCASAAEGIRIRSIRIEAPNRAAAALLVQDLVAFAPTDIVPLDEERWEVRVPGSSQDELDAVLHAVARWVADCQLSDTQVLVDGEHVHLPSA